MKKTSIKQGPLPTSTFVEKLDSHLSGLSTIYEWDKEERKAARLILTNHRIIQELEGIIEGERSSVEDLATLLGEVVCLPQRFEQLITHRRKQTLQEQTEAALKNIGRFRKEINRNRNIITEALAFTSAVSTKPNAPSIVDQLNTQLDTLQSALQGFKVLLADHPTPIHSRKSRVASANLIFFVREAHGKLRRMTGHPNFRLIAELATICLRLQEPPLLYDLKQICRTRK